MTSLRVVHVAEEMSVLAGGVPAVVRQLSERLSDLGVKVQVLHALGDSRDVPGVVEFFHVPPAGLGRAWWLGPGLRETCVQLATHADGRSPVFHVHGVWAAPQWFACRAAHSAEVPFVFTAHGMLEPWLWSEQGWKVWAKKKVYWATLGYPMLAKARIIHAITELEKQHLSRLFPGNRIEVIPNAIDVDSTESPTSVQREKSILFLGRIDPKKGVDILLRAFAKARIGKDWRIDIAGPSWSDDYFQGLERLAVALGITQRVAFHGPVFGEMKRRLMDVAWVMAVPSHSEAVGLVNLEAAVHGLPTITTPQTGLADWEIGGGILTQPTDDGVCKALEAACAWTDQEQRDRGAASWRLVQQRYSWDATLPLWQELYASL